MKSMADIAEEIVTKYGREAADWAVELAGKYAKTDRHGEEILRFCQATAGMVPSFTGRPQDDRLFDCPECSDRDFVVVSGKYRHGSRPPRAGGRSPPLRLPPRPGA